MRGSKILFVPILLAIVFFSGVLPRAWSSSIPDKDYRIVINIPSRTLWVYSGDKIVRWFPVGVGRPGFSTPVGQFHVTRKILNPGWENPYKPQGASRIRPGAGNPLGTRWIGFHPYKGGEYGIHGTNRPSSVGRFSSHGCVRMKIKDAETLFDLVTPGTPVEVRYDLVLIRKHENKIRIATYRDAFHQGRPSAAEIRQQILEQFPSAQVNDVQLLAALQNSREHYTEVGIVPENTAPESPSVLIASRKESALEKKAEKKSHDISDQPPLSAESPKAGSLQVKPEEQPLRSSYAMLQTTKSTTMPAEQEDVIPQTVEIDLPSIPERWFVQPLWRKTHP